MAFTETSNIAGPFTCDGVEDEFDFDFTLYNDDTDNLEVISTDADGNETTLTITTHYTVASTNANDDYSDGGTVTITDSDYYASGLTVTIVQKISIAQALDLVENDDLPSEDLEDAIDKIYFIAQEINRKADASIREPDSEPDDVSMILPAAADRADKYIKFGSSGEVSVATEVSSDTVTITAAAETVLDDATVAAMRTTLDVLQDADEVIDADKLAAGASYKSAVTRYFTPSYSGYVSNITDVKITSSGIVFETTADTNDHARLPVNLPDGAIVTELKAWINSDGTRTIDVYLLLGCLNNTTTATMAQCSSSVDGITEVTDSSISAATIDNTTYSYNIYIDIDGTPSEQILVLGIRIAYTIAKPLP